MLPPADEPARPLRAWPGVVAGVVLLAAIASGVGALRLARHATSADQDEASVIPRLQVVRAPEPKPAGPPVAPLAANLPPANSLPAAMAGPLQVQPVVRLTPVPPLLSPAAKPTVEIPTRAASELSRRLPLAEPPPAPSPRAPSQAAMADAGPSPSGCDNLRSYAAQLVCDDPQLSAADRRLWRAYTSAIRSGAPEHELRADQEEWLRAREDAARYSRRAVMNVYRQRIDELEVAARDAPE